ncbi:Zinc knuckle CX2CX4HX4C [Sesbania bispinosa]|nr:Zinc knuckle CX2CX4HX4C [Sesbania bispinosa]
MENNEHNNPPGGRSSPRSIRNHKLIVFSEDNIQEGLKDYEFSVVGNIVSEKKFNVNSLINALSNIWNHPTGFKIVDLGEKKFQFFFHKEKDMERVLKGQPWMFRNSWLLLKRWQRSQNPKDMVFDKVHCWVQSLGLTHSLSNNSNETSHRIIVLVEIDISNPLLPGIDVGSKNDGVFWVNFQFEKLPQFCYSCGLIGHDEDSCSGKIQSKEGSTTLGPWMRTTQVGRKLHSGNPSQQYDRPTPNPQEEERRNRLAQELLDKLSDLSVSSCDHQNA